MQAELLTKTKEIEVLKKEIQIRQEKIEVLMKTLETSQTGQRENEAELKHLLSFPNQLEEKEQALKRLSVEKQRVDLVTQDLQREVARLEAELTELKHRGNKVI